MKKLKALKIIHLIGYTCLFIATIFSFVNSFCPEPIFRSYIILPLLLIGIVGIVTGIIYLVKAPIDKESSTDSDEKAE